MTMFRASKKVFILSWLLHGLTWHIHLHMCWLLKGFGGFLTTKDNNFVKTFILAFLSDWFELIDFLFKQNALPIVRYQLVDGYYAPNLYYMCSLGLCHHKRCANKEANHKKQLKNLLTEKNSIWSDLAKLTKPHKNIKSRKDKKNRF